MPAAAPADDGLPEWLRPLQSGGLGPAASGRVSSGSLVSEEALPAWLRGPDMSGALGNGAGGAGPAGNWGMQPSNMPPAPADPYAFPLARGPMQAGGPYAQAPLASNSMPLGTSARALFDESALPDWLRQASAANDIGQQPTAYQPAQVAPSRFGNGMAQQGISAPNQNGGYGAAQQPAAQSYAPGGANQAWPAPAGAFPASEPASVYSHGVPSGALNAPSLIDPNALPAWLSGGQAQERSPGIGGLSNVGNGDHPGNSSGMAANSLVDESALPQWLRSAEPARAVPPAAAYANVPAPAPWGATAAVEEPLPTWLKQVYVEANVPQSDTLRAPSGWSAGGSAAGAAGAAGASGMGDVAASSFVDDSALPEWLRSAGAPAGGYGGVTGNGGGGGTGGMSGGTGYHSAALPAASPLEQAQIPVYVPQTAMGASGDFGAGGAGAGGGNVAGIGSFAASDLIDPAVLPSWVQGQGPPVETSFSSTSGWTSRQRAMPPSAAGTGTSESRVANPRGSSDLPMDESNLPAWMRGAPAGGPAPTATTGWGAATFDRAPATPYASGALGSSDERRRGPPIPSEELPQWLQSGGQAARGAYPGGGAYGAYDAYGGGQPRQDEPAWPEEDGAAGQWTDWDDRQYAQDYGRNFEDDGYDGYDGYDAPQERKRGWRRFFGRG